MTVKIKFFAILRDLAGVAESELELPAGATVATAAAVLESRFPGMAKALGRAAFAVNLTKAGGDVVLRDGDELALLPPVSGGVG